MLPRAEQLRLHDTQRGPIPETRPRGTLQPCQMDSQCQSMGRRQRADNGMCCTYAAIGYGGHRVYPGGLPPLKRHIPAKVAETSIVLTKMAAAFFVLAIAGGDQVGVGNVGRIG